MSGFSTRYRWPTWQSTDSANLYQLQPTMLVAIEGTVGGIEDRVKDIETKGQTVGCGASIVGSDTTYGTQSTPIALAMATGAQTRGPISVGAGGAVVIGSGGAGFYVCAATIRFQGSTTGAAMPIQTVGLYKNGAALHIYWPDVSVVNAHSVQLAFANVQAADGDSFTWQFAGGNGLRNIGANSHYSFQRGV